MNRKYHIGNEYIEVAVDTINEMLDWANRNTPEISALLNGQKIYNSTGQPHKSIADKVKQITQAAPCRAYVEYNGYSIWLNIDCHYPIKHYPDGGSCVTYSKKNIYIGNINRDNVIEVDEISKTPLFTAESVRGMIKDYEKAYTVASDAESALRDAEFKLDLFVK